MSADTEILQLIIQANAEGGSALTFLNNLDEGLKKLGVSEKNVAAIQEKASKIIKERIGIINNLKNKIKELEELRGLSQNNKEIGRFSQEIDRLKKELDDAEKGTGKFSTGLKSLEKTFTDVIKPVGLGIAAFAAYTAALVGVIKVGFDFANNASEFVRANEAIAKSTGSNIKDVTVLTEAIKAQNGDVRDVADALSQLNQKVSEASVVNSEASKTFRDADIDIRNLNGSLKSGAQIFKELDEQARTTGLTVIQLTNLAKNLGEDSAKKLIPLLGNLGRIREEVEKFNLVVSEKTSKTLEKFRQDTQSVSRVATGLLTEFGATVADQLIPLLEQVRDTLGQALSDPNIKQSINDLIKFTSSFTVAPVMAFVEAIRLTSVAVGEYGIALRQIKANIQSAVDSFNNFSNRIEEIFNGQERGIEITGKVIDANTKLNNSVDEINKKYSDNKEALEQAGLGYELIGSLIDQIVNKTKVLSQINDENANLFEQSIARQLVSIQELLQKGSITREEAAKRENDLQKTLLDQKLANSRQELRLAEETAQNIINSKSKELEELRIKEEQYRQDRINLNLEIKDATLKGDTARLASAIDTSGKLFQLQNDTQSKIIKSLEAIRQARIVIGLEELKDSDAVNTKLVANQKALADQRLEVSRLESEKLTQQRQEQLNTFKAIIETTQRQIQILGEEEEKQTRKLQDQLDDREISRQKYELSLLAIQQERLRKELAEEVLQLQKLNAQKVKNIEAIQDTENRIAKLKLGIEDKTNKLRLETEKQYNDELTRIYQNSITERTNKLNEYTRRSTLLGRSELEQAQQIDRVTKSNLDDRIRLLRIQLDIKRQEGGTDQELRTILESIRTLEEERRDINREITGAVADQVKQANALAESTRNATNQAGVGIQQITENLQQVSGNLRQVADLTSLAFNFNPITATKEEIIKAREEVEKYRLALEEAQRSSATIDPLAGVNEQVILDRLGILQQSIAQAEERIRSESVQKQIEERLKLEKELTDALIQIEATRNARIVAANKAFREAKRAIDKEDQDIKLQLLFDIGEANNKAEQDRLDFATEISERIIEQARQEFNARVQFAIKLEKELATRQAKSNEKESKERVSFIDDLLDFEEKRQNKLIELQKAKSENQSQEIIDKLKSELAGIDAQIEERTNKEKERKSIEDRRNAEKQSAIDKANKERDKATNADDIERINSELSSTLDAIDAKFDAEIDFQDRIKKARELGRDDLVKLLEEELRAQQQAAIDKANAEITEANRQFQEKERLRLQAQEDQRIADEKRLSDIQKNLDAEILRLTNAATKALGILDDRLRAEEKKHRDSLTQIEKDTQTSLDVLKLKYDAFFKGVQFSTSPLDNTLKDLIARMQELIDKEELAKKGLDEILNTGDDANKGDDDGKPKGPGKKVGATIIPGESNLTSTNSSNPNTPTDKKGKPPIFSGKGNKDKRRDDFFDPANITTENTSNTVVTQGSMTAYIDVKIINNGGKINQKELETLFDKLAESTVKRILEEIAAEENLVANAGINNGRFTT